MPLSAPPRPGPAASPCASTDYVVTNLLQPRCGLCHDRRNGSAFVAIDLISPGVRERLRGSSTGCVGARLVVTAPSVGGNFFDKITGKQRLDCGVRMPPVGPALPPEEIECLRTWVSATP